MNQERVMNDPEIEAKAEQIEAGMCTPVRSSSGTEPVPTLVQEALAILKWLREPDYAEKFSLDDAAAWLNDRPVAAMCRVVDGVTGGAAQEVLEPDEDHPDCVTDREHELYDALMVLSSAVTARQGWSKWVQGGVQIAPIVHKALRLASLVSSTDREGGK